MENSRISLHTLGLASAQVGFWGCPSASCTSVSVQLSACSAWAGEYEDPDETTWTEEPDEDQEQQRQQEEFSVRRNQPVVHRRGK